MKESQHDDVRNGGDINITHSYSLITIVHYIGLLMRKICHVATTGGLNTLLQLLHKQVHNQNHLNTNPNNTSHKNGSEF